MLVILVFFDLFVAVWSHLCRDNWFSLFLRILLISFNFIEKGSRSRKHSKLKIYKFSWAAEYCNNMVKENLFLAKTLLSFFLKICEREKKFVLVLSGH